MRLLHLSLIFVTFRVVVTFRVDFCYIRVVVTFSVVVTCSGDTPSTWRNMLGKFICNSNTLLPLLSDVVTCLSLDNDGRHLMCGSRDTTSTIWTVAHQSGLAQEMSRAPIQTLYGHDDEVTCVAVSWELDVAISGSKVHFWLFMRFCVICVV